MRENVALMYITAVPTWACLLIYLFAINFFWRMQASPQKSDKIIYAFHFSKAIFFMPNKLQSRIKHFRF